MLSKRIAAICMVLVLSALPAYGQVSIFRDVGVSVSLSMEKVAGDAQASCAGGTLTEKLKIKVVNKNGDGVPGATVEFAVTSKPSGATDGTFSETTVTTNEDGEAETEYTLGDMTGDYEIEAMATDSEVMMGGTQTFTVTSAEVMMTKPTASMKVKFDNASTGKLEIENEAKVTPDNAATQAFFKDKIKFEIAAVGSSMLKWDNADGVAVYSNGAFTVKGTFEGLPDKNDDFGKKEVKMIVDGCMPLDDKREIQVFYDAVATNHPGGVSSDPNWFFYYKQNAGGGSYKYDSSLRTSQAVPGGGESTIKIADNAYTGGFYRTTQVTNGQLKVTGTGISATFKYYTYFFGVVAHEREHANNQTTAGPPTDADRDFIAGTYETQTSQTDPNDACSALGMPMCGALIDAEIYAGGPIEEAAIKAADTSKDWASPGTNW